MDISEQAKLEIAKLALDYLVSIQVNKSEEQMALLVSQARVEPDKLAFEHVFNVLFDTICHKVVNEPRHPVPPYSYS